MPTVSSQDLQTFHSQCESKAQNLLSKFLETNSKKFKDPIILEQESKKQLAKLISESFSTIQRLAEQKSENARTQARNNLAKAVKEFDGKLKKTSKRSQ